MSDEAPLKGRGKAPETEEGAVPSGAGRNENGCWVPEPAPGARREMRFGKTGEGREKGEEVFRPIMRQGKIKCRLGGKKRRKKEKEKKKTEKASKGLCFGEVSSVPAK